MESIDVGAAFLLGLFGGMHCMGMCGGIIVALTAGQRKIWWPGIAAYHTARVLTYILLGVAAGFAGSLLAAPSHWPDAQKGLSIFAGAVIVIFAMQLGGWLPERWGRFPILIPAQLLKKASTAGSIGVWGAVGFFNGLLPCGLVYAALAMALASGSMLSGSLIMLAFGAGTIPALVTVSAFMRLLGPVMRGRLLRVMAFALLLYGGWMTSRGFLSHGSHHDAHPHGVHSAGGSEQPAH